LQKAAAAASFADQHTTFESLSCSDGDGTVNSSAESISVQLETSMQQIDESGSALLEISLPDKSAAEENARQQFSNQLAKKKKKSKKNL
jgi:ACT domain-containing protein